MDIETERKRKGKRNIKKCTNFEMPTPSALSKSCDVERFADKSLHIVESLKTDSCILLRIWTFI